MWTIQFYIAVSVLVLITSTGCHGAIRIYSFPSPLYFTNGHTLSITCEHPDNMVFMHWTHPTEGVVSVSQGRKIVTHFDSVQGVRYVSLRINNARQSDAGDYRCHFRQGGATHMSTSLRANYRMNIMLISPAHTDAVLAVGETLSVFCNASHFNSRQWLRLSSVRSAPRVVRATSDGRVTISSNMHLQIRNVRLGDQAIYRCALRNELTPREGVNIDVNLTVVVRPVALVTPEVHVVGENTTASIACRVTGFPYPEVTWRDGRSNLVINNPVEGLTIHTVTENSTSQLSTLTFSSVQRHQEGDYTCHADDTHYGYSDSATGFLRLAGTPDRPTNVHLSVVNQTNILVTWDAPHSEVETYVVSWNAVGTRGSQMHRLNSSLVTNFTITGLRRLTQYSVTIYATNSKGRGMTSHPTNITTLATVPSAPVEVVILDVGSESVRVEWSDSLPMDNGGALIRKVRLSYKEVSAEEWTDEALEVDAGNMFTVVSGLRDRRTYHIKMEVGNVIGYGPSAISEPFDTLHPGYPGSPSHVVTRNLTHDSAVVCWLESSFGRPFISYSVEIAESSSNLRAKIQRFDSSQVGRVQDCDTGVVVTDLNPKTCYRFSVSVRNSQGVGRPSSVSDEYCTPSLCSNSACSTGSPAAFSLSPQVLAGVVAGSVVVVMVVVLAFIVCLVMRQHKKSALKKSRHNCSSSMDSGISQRKESDIMAASSSANLVTQDHKAPIFSCSSFNGSPEALQETPNTSTTILSNDEQNPFDFNMRGSQSIPVMHPQPVLCPQTNDHLEYTQSSLYPILEHPPPYQHRLPHPLPLSQLPVHLGRSHPHHHYPHQPKLTNQGGNCVTVMTDNPNYVEQEANFRQNCSSEIREPVQIRYPYHGDAMSEVDSEISVPLQKIPTPHFGESYSQSGCSPVMQRKTNANRFFPAGGESNAVIQNRSISEIDSRGGYSSTANSYKKYKSDEEDEDTEFVDNDAYMTFTRPKFEIIGSEEKGAVLETVQVKQH